MNHDDCNCTIGFLILWRLLNDSQEKVEEDRYIRELEAKYIENKKAEMAAQMAADEEKEFVEKIAPVMAEAEVLLEKSGDSISQEGLEALAHWKLGL